MSLFTEALQAAGLEESQVNAFLTILDIALKEKQLRDQVEQAQKLKNETLSQELSTQSIQAPSIQDLGKLGAELEAKSAALDLTTTIAELKKKGVNIDANILVDLPEEKSSKIKALLEINALCQATLMRPVNSERQQLNDSKQLLDLRERITAELIKLGFIGEVKPQNKTPDALLILGASQAGYTARLQQTLVYLKEENIKPGAIYLLGGQRPLWPAEEKSEPITEDLLCERLNAKGQTFKVEDLRKLLLDKKTALLSSGMALDKVRLAIEKEYVETYGIKWPTELDMMVRVTQNTDLSGIQFIAVDTPMQRDAEGKEVRPSTIHTVNEFKNKYAPQIKPKNGTKISVMAVSSQPHVNYQDKPIREVLDAEQFDIEVVGKKVDASKYTIREAFDALARSVFSGLAMSLKKLAKLDHNPVASASKSEPRKYSNTYNS